MAWTNAVLLPQQNMAMILECHCHSAITPLAHKILYCRNQKRIQTKVVHEGLLLQGWQKGSLPTKLQIWNPEENSCNFKRATRDYPERQESSNQGKCAHWFLHVWEAEPTESSNQGECAHWFLNLREAEHKKSSNQGECAHWFSHLESFL